MGKVREENDSRESFTHLLGKSPQIGYGLAGFGLFIGWICQGLLNGKPHYEAGLDHTWPVAILFGAFSLTLAIVIWLVHNPRTIPISPLHITGTACAMLGTLVAALDHALWHLPAVLGASLAIIGIGAALLAISFSYLFCRLGLKRSFYAMAFSSVFCFVGYITVAMHAGYSQTIFLCLLPLLGGTLSVRPISRLAHSLQAEQFFPGRQQHRMPKGFYGFTALCFLCALLISFMRAMDDIKDFAIGSQDGVLLMMALILVLAILCHSGRVQPIHLLQGLYLVSMCLLIAGLILSRVIRDWYVPNAVLNMVCLSALVFLWITAAVAMSSNRLLPSRCSGAVLLSIGIGLLVGWAFGQFAHTVPISQPREVFNIAVGASLALACTFIFTPGTLKSLVEHECEAPDETMAVPVAADSDADGAGATIRFEVNAATAQKYDLTNREMGILSLLAQGLNAKAISEQLVISYHTVRAHLAKIYSKMEVHSVQELLLKLQENEEGPGRN